MAVRETSRSIDDAAAAWFAREDRGELSQADQAALNAWLTADPRHPGALLRARAIAMHSEAAVALNGRFESGQFSPAVDCPVLSRRRMLIWGGGGIASVSAAAIAGLVLKVPTAHATERGQMRLVPLPDGSTVMLNTETRIIVRYTRHRRLVRVERGEVDFSIRADSIRPFVVMAGDRLMNTFSDCGFLVRKLPDAPIDILVHLGHLEVEGRNEAAPVRLTSNMHFILDTTSGKVQDSQPKPVSPGLVRRELAWREGKIAFEGESLAEAASAFDRYSDVRIVIADPILAREPVTGLFVASDPVGFGRAVANLFGVPVNVARGEVVVGTRRSAG